MHCTFWYDISDPYIILGGPVRLDFSFIVYVFSWEEKAKVRLEDISIEDKEWNRSKSMYIVWQVHLASLAYVVHQYRRS